ncbi:site-specific DNA-methyltransferase [Mycoplasma sp. Pen4]|nr:site-specific DNA-methyltransferase [Mycoplasma sp. Pen4]
MLEGNSEKLIKKLDDNSIKLIYGSPPYPNAKRNYGIWKTDEYLKTIDKFLSKCLPKLRDDGFIVINVKANRNPGKKGSFSSERSLIIEELMLHMKKKLKLYCVDIEIWLKSNPVPTGLRVACQDAYEYNLWFSKSPEWQINIDAIRNEYQGSSLKTYEATIFKPRINGLNYVAKEKKIKPNSKGCLPKNVFINKNDEMINSLISNYQLQKETLNSYSNVIYGATSSRSLNHQAIQPEYVPQKYILACTNENDIVLDPWCGSGTTGVVAVKNGRKFIGFEILSEYVELSNQRISEVLKDVDEH